MANNYICALDIGSSKLAACLARFKGRRIEELVFNCMSSRGIKGGIIIDSIELVSSLTKLLRELKEKSGINIKQVHCGISGRNVSVKLSRAIIPLAERGSKIITAHDLRRVNEQARILGLNMEEEVLHALPRAYAIDSAANILNPIGLYSHKLEAEILLICAKSSCVQSLIRCVNQSGFDIKGVHFGAFSLSKSVFTKEELTGQSVFCDFGDDTTELLIFSDGMLSDFEVVPEGGNSFTFALARELKVPYELAEDIKISYGSIGTTEHLGEDKEILVKNSDFYRPIKQKDVCEILTNEAKRVSLSIKCALESKVSLHKIDSIVIAGRAVLMDGLIETLENALEARLRSARISDPDVAPLIKKDSAVSGRRYLTYLSCLGMICSSKDENNKDYYAQSQPAKKLPHRLLNKLKDLYQEYF